MHQPTKPADTIKARLAFMRLDDDKRAVLRALRPVIDAVLPGLLDEFYAHIMRHPEVARFFPDSRTMRQAKDMQAKHWDLILTADFDDTYVKSVTRIGETHNRLGLEPRWYIGGYSLILGGIVRAIETQVSAGWLGNARARKAEMLSVATTAVMLDMDFVVSAYLEARRSARSARLDRLAASFDDSIGKIVDKVLSTADQLETAASTLTKTAETTQQLSHIVTSASEEASNNVQTVASATDQLTGSVNEIRRQVTESSKIAGEAVQQAEKTDARIAELSQAASRIGDVVKLITAIAEQTNLLALNATIEAARAGEAGKGFAVVAQEVKALAAQTAKATDEIGMQIAGMQAATQESVAAIKEIGDTIDRIAQIAATISTAVQEQGAATTEIARNVQAAAKGTTQVASNITGVNRGAGETGTAAAQVLSSAQSLSGESSRLKAEVDRFLATVRAA